MEYAEKMILIPFSSDKNDKLRSFLEKTFEIKDEIKNEKKEVIKTNTSQALYTKIPPKTLKREKKLDWLT